VNEQTQSWLKITGSVLVVAVAAGVLVHQARNFNRRGEEGATVWFYDQSEHRLYAAPQSAIPPHPGIGGKNGDGVKAIVVAFRSEQADPSKRRIAYLETFTPELKSLMEEARAARASGRKFEGTIPSRDSDFLQANTLVKRPDDAEWHPSNSPEGLKIASAWRLWKSADGQAPIICVP
jgi:hypothetical protein